MEIDWTFQVDMCSFPLGKFQFVERILNTRFRKELTSGDLEKTCFVRDNLYTRFTILFYFL
jgi:hypothetical protein